LCSEEDSWSPAIVVRWGLDGIDTDQSNEGWVDETLFHLHVLPRLKMPANDRLVETKRGNGKNFT
jgi:hypothetical protein